MPRSIQLADPPPRIALEVRGCSEVGRGLYLLRLSRLPAPWRPGDCIAVYAEAGGESRPYSMCSDPAAGQTELLIRRFPGGRFSERLTRLSPGDRIEVSPPFGWFHPGTSERPEIHFATGTGIAPFLSAVRAGARPVRVYWGVRHSEDAFAREVFPDLRVRCSRAPREGRITDWLEEVPVDPATHYFACGLDRMIEEVAAYLTRRGVESSRIHREIFFTAPPNQPISS